jgi:6-pyruvoyltetrahydropterin/6-carboxytetrahydropterin synthase
MGFQAKRYHDICAGHRVVGHEGKCRNLHGHNYRIHFTVEPEMIYPIGHETGGLDNVGRVLDFSVINSYLCQWTEKHWDHKMLLWDQDPALRYLMEEPEADGIVIVPFNPTAENLARYLVEVIGPQQLSGSGCMLTRVEIEETRKCNAVYERRKL